MTAKRSNAYADLLRYLREALGTKSRKVPEGVLHPEKTRTGRLEEWQRLLEALQANREDLEYLSTHSQELETLLSRVEDLLQSQAALEAGRKAATQRLAVLLADCQRLATVLRFSLKHHYGPTAEKLTDFGIQPAQGRKRKSVPAVE